VTNFSVLTCNQATVQLYSLTTARYTDKYDAAVPVYTAYNDSLRNARKYHIDSQAPENTSHFAMRITLFSSLVHLQLTQSQNWLPWQRPLDPRSRLCLHWIACPENLESNSESLVATAEVMSIQSLPVPPPPTPRGQPISEMGGGPQPCLVCTCSHSYRLTILF